MNAPKRLPPYLAFICRKCYRGYPLIETGDGVKIVVGQKEQHFANADEAKQYIDLHLSKVVVLN